MSDTIALDVHAHLIPVVEERLAAIDGVSWNAVEQAMTIDGHKVGIKPIFNPEALIAWMDKTNVEHTFVSAPPPLYRQHLRGVKARGWADYINDGLMEIAAQSRGRMTALVHLPTEDPQVATAIVRAFADVGHNRFAMPAGAGDERTLGLEEFEPLWAELDAAGAFVFLHPGECADGRLKSFYLTNLLGNPYESTVALAHLIFAGVLERHPRIVPCLAHGGGLLPMVAGRFERGVDTARPGVDTARAAPSKVLRGVYVDCICHSEAAAIHAEATFGAGNVIFGSDWPFPMGLVEPHHQLASFEPARRQLYFQTNPVALLARINKKGDP